MKNPNTCRLLMFAIILLGISIVYLSGLIWGVEQIAMMSVCGLLLSFGGIIFGIVTVRCPSCKSLLNLRGLGSSYCEHCGSKIE